MTGTININCSIFKTLSPIHNIVNIFDLIITKYTKRVVLESRTLSILKLLMNNVVSKNSKLLKLKKGVVSNMLTLLTKIVFKTTNEMNKVISKTFKTNTVAFKTLKTLLNRVVSKISKALITINMVVSCTSQTMFYL